MVNKKNKIILFRKLVLLIKALVEKILSFF